MWGWITYLSPRVWIQSVWTAVREHDYRKMALQSAIGVSASLMISTAGYYFLTDSSDARVRMTAEIMRKVDEHFKRDAKKSDIRYVTEYLRFVESNDRLPGTKATAVYGYLTFRDKEDLILANLGILAIFTETRAPLWRYLSGTKTVEALSFLVPTLGEFEEVRFINHHKGHPDVLYFRAVLVTKGIGRAIGLVERGEIGWDIHSCAFDNDADKPAYRQVDAIRFGDLIQKSGPTELETVLWGRQHLREASPGQWIVLELTDILSKGDQSQARTAPRYGMIVWRISDLGGSCRPERNWNGGRPLVLSEAQVGEDQDVLTVMYERRKNRIVPEVSRPTPRR